MLDLHFSGLLYLSVTTRAVIGKFCRPYDGPINLNVSFPARPIDLRDIVSMLLITFSRSVL